VQLKFAKGFYPFAGKRFVLRLTCISQNSRAHKPKADIVVPVVGIVVVPIG